MRQGKHDAASLRICTLAAGFTLTEKVIMMVLTIVIVVALLATIGTLLCFGELSPWQREASSISTTVTSSCSRVELQGVILLFLLIALFIAVK